MPVWVVISNLYTIPLDKVLEVTMVKIKFGKVGDELSFLTSVIIQPVSCEDVAEVEIYTIWQTYFFVLS